MLGGAGNDTYIVDSTSDTVTEESGEGTDLIQSSVSYTASNNVEKLTLTGSGSINATGNSLNNILTGNNSSNAIYGNYGDDTLIGNSGHDILYGGLGNDELRGDSGNDIFQLNSGVGRDLITDYTPGEDSIEFLGGITYSDVTFISQGNDTSIKYQDDLLAVIENTIASDLNFI